VKFLSNIHDPRDKEDANMNLARKFGESTEVAWEYYKNWLKGKVIGRPQPSATRTVEELEELGLVGVYDPE